jgi:hypothetical protein
LWWDSEGISMISLYLLLSFTMLSSGGGSMFKEMKGTFQFLPFVTCQASWYRMGFHFKEVHSANHFHSKVLQQNVINWSTGWTYWALTSIILFHQTSNYRLFIDGLHRTQSGHKVTWAWAWALLTQLLLHVKLHLQ